MITTPDKPTTTLAQDCRRLEWLRRKIAEHAAEVEQLKKRIEENLSRVH